MPGTFAFTRRNDVESNLKSSYGPPLTMFPLVRLWVCFCVYASLPGWCLSAFGQLNRVGCAVSLAMFVAFIGWQRKSLGLVGVKMKLRRFRRPLPFSFLVLAGLVFLGGILYPPSNYTGLTYHVPRVLHWLAHEQWHWIHTPVVRMDFSGCGFEWLYVPILLFTGSDRALFLLNFIPFLLLPGLTFSVFSRLGVRPKVARQWMWLLPTGYIYLLQAGSIVNDAFVAILVLAAMDFGCRAWQTRPSRDLLYSILAAALMTGTKATTLPLLLPWLLLVVLRLPILRRNWAVTIAAAIIAAAVSFLPVAVMNKVHTDDWLGATIETSHLEIKQPLVGLAGNAFQLTLDNLTPPVFPLAGWWNQNVPLMMPQSVRDAVAANFDHGLFAVGELPTEDWAGVGFGISLLLAVGVVGTFWFQSKIPKPPLIFSLAIPPWLRRGVLAAAWLSLGAYSVKSGMTTAARLVAPYYALLIPSLLQGPALLRVIRTVTRKVLVGVVVISALAVLVVSPDRPLWPAKTVLSRWHHQHPNQKLIDRALRVYTTYAGRFDALADVRALLPRGTKVVGFMGTADDSDISLWRPYGSRRVEHFFFNDPPELMRSKVDCLVVSEGVLASNKTTIDTWLEKNQAELIASTKATLKVGEGPLTWYVVRFKN